MTLTPGGELLHRKASRLIEATRAVEDEVRRLDGVPRGLLRVSIPTGMPHALWAAWLAEFLRRCPEVSIEMVASGTHVDLVADGFDLGLVRGEVEDASLIARTLTVDTSIALASPAYLAARGTPSEPEQLAVHDCILGHRGGKLPELRWPLLDGGYVAVSGNLTTNEMKLRLEAAKQDLGIALLSPYLAHAELERGVLVQVLPGVVGRRERVSLIYADREYLDPKIRAFVDFVVDKRAGAQRDSSTHA